MSEGCGENRTDAKFPSTNIGTIANFDMLILHENSTLPLSDACSKSVSFHWVRELNNPIAFQFITFVCGTSKNG